MVDFDYMPTAALALFVNHLSILRNRRLRGRVKLRAVKLGGQTCGFSLLARLSFRLQSEWEVAGGITRRQWSHSPHTHRRLSRNRVINAPSDAGSVSVVRLIGCHGDNRALLWLYHCPIAGTASLVPFQRRALHD